MSSPSKVALVLGAGGNIGASVASLFTSQGYKVALAARRLQDTVHKDGHLHIKIDLEDSDSIAAAFDKTAAQFGVPNVVIYNAAAFPSVPADDPLSASHEQFSKALVVNTNSVYVAAQRAVQDFRTLPSSVPKTFLYTGNILNLTVAPTLLALGVGKAATAHLIQAVAKAYADEGFRFYYVDERQADGRPVYSNISGLANAQHFLDLAATSELKPWLQTFVDGQGYKDFSGTEPLL